MIRFVILAWSMLMLGLAAPADAALLQFTISGTDSLSGVTPAPMLLASFQIESSPVIDPINTAPGDAFAIGDIAGTFRYGNRVLPSPQSINFYSTAQGGGLFIGNGFPLGFDGPQLYSGTEDAPTFLTGDFTLTRFGTGSPVSLTIRQVSAIPEPASWATMLIGFGMIGGMARYRRRRVSIVHA